MTMTTKMTNMYFVNLLSPTKTDVVGALGVFLVLLISSPSVSPAGPGASDWRPPCPPWLQNCDNGTGLVTFGTSTYSHVEYANEGYYKDLNCYPENFCHIQWLKDGLPYPWGWSLTQLRMMGVAQGTCNSTLEFKRAGLEARGVYTCLVTGANGTTISRNITLRLKAAPEPAPPIAVAGDLCANHTAKLGADHVNFTCAIYVGEENSFMSYAYWMVEVQPGRWVFGKQVHIPGTNITTTEGREAGGYLTSSLSIEPVVKGAYVNYRLHISNGLRNSEVDFHLSAKALPEVDQVVSKTFNKWWRRLGKIVPRGMRLRNA